MKNMNWIISFMLYDTEVSCQVHKTCILPCSFTAHDDVVIHWIQETPPESRVHSYHHKQDRLREQAQRFRGRTSLFEDQISRGNASMLLRRVKVQDQGRYLCNISTITGNKENFINLNVNAPVQNVNIAQVQNKITCSSEGIYPEPGLTWTTNPPSSMNLQNPPTVQQTEQQLYSISSSLILSDGDSDLDYICNVSTPANSRRSTLLQLAVISGSDTERKISCSTANYPIRNLIWTFNHKEIILTQSGDEGRYITSERWKQHVMTVSRTGSLMLKNLSSDQTGTYKCELSDEEETYVKYTFLHIPKDWTGVIVGVVMGVLLVVLVSGVVGYKYRKRRKEKRRNKGDKEDVLVLDQLGMEEHGSTEEVRQKLDVLNQLGMEEHDSTEEVRPKLISIKDSSEIRNSERTKISSGYEDMISQSDLIRPGRPAVYQLKPKAQDIGTLKRLTVGEKNFTKTNKTILLVGETGTGKSTLVNALVNYTMGVKFKDKVWFRIVEDEKKSQAESQTSDVIVYEIFGFEDKTLPFSLTIIDTPGYGDTRGKEYDAIINQRLLDLFGSEDGVHEMDAVCLVLKASVNRVSDRMTYIFDSVMSLFGKDMEKNIIALITHSDGMPPENALQALLAANIKCAKNEKNQPVHFLFNNRQENLRDKKTKVPLEYAWRQTTKGMQQFSEFLKKTESQELKTTVEVLKSQQQLIASIHNLQEKIKSTEKMKEEIDKTQMQLKLNESQLENDEYFTIEVEESYKELEEYGDGWSWWSLSYHGVTRCESCEENCHCPCTDTWGATYCLVMGMNGCTMCKCSDSQHVKDTQRYVIKTRKVKTTIEGLKKKFQANVNDTSGLLGVLDEKKKEHEEKIKQLVEEAFSHVQKLRDSAMTVKTMSTQAYLGFLIKKMREFGKTAEVQILEEIVSQVEEGSKSLLEKTFG
ncbi:uncharacterized protein LOC133419028 isoform X2 [Cololabis saira]|uniref:uncharacterized protein LOC133419028 isoform X2 n=1 Tax=Cololabis saira TaxID=129043 RepID=UPI002AD1E901|nr:uncharacterized protein LOC133419028 isoform X2 [Cololabis saira]